MILRRLQFTTVKMIGAILFGAPLWMRCSISNVNILIWKDREPIVDHALRAFVGISSSLV